MNATKLKLLPRQTQPIERPLLETEPAQITPAIAPSFWTRSSCPPGYQRRRGRCIPTRIGVRRRGLL